MDEIDDLIREELDDLLRKELDDLFHPILNNSTNTNKLPVLLTATPMANDPNELVGLLNNLLLPILNNSKINETQTHLTENEIDELLRDELDELRLSESDSDDDHSAITMMMSEYQGRVIKKQKIMCNHCYKKMADYVCIEKKCKSKSVCKTCYDKHPHSLVKM